LEQTVSVAEAAGLTPLPRRCPACLSPGVAAVAGFGGNAHTGLRDREVDISGDGIAAGALDADRLIAQLIVGPTGVGKSTLIANMALQDIAAGRGVVVINPKGDDLVPNILSRNTRAPPQRRDRPSILRPPTTGGLEPPPGCSG